MDDNIQEKPACRIMTAEEMKCKAVKIEKISELFIELTDKKVKSIVVLKSGQMPLVHFLAVPHGLIDKLELMLKICDVELKCVEVFTADFGDIEVAEAPK